MGESKPVLTEEERQEQTKRYEERAHVSEAPPPPLPRGVWDWVPGFCFLNPLLINTPSQFMSISLELFPLQYRMLELVAQKQREREEREEREALERERQRRRQGQELSAARQRLQEDEMRRAAEERRREKAEELAARSGCWGCWLRDEKGIKICIVSV